mmetsp:Transcript_16793/g.35505  ORF Transcript_16793/g.35505 Transcript_16793/m.35505 type:complete len:309 (-) Transcript_16793:338-1264(-)
MDTTVHNPAAAFANVRQGSFEVKPEEIEYFEKIGEGAMAVIYRAKMRNLTCAAKKLKNSTRTDSQAYKDLVMELDVLTSVGKHQNLVEFYGACVQDPTNPVILEEFVEGPNLEHFLEKKSPGFNLGRTTIYSWSLDIVRALDHLHNRNPIIMHRDLKPANMMLTKDLNTLKLADFGMSKKMSLEERTQMAHKGHTGTLRYMAPEVVAQRTSNYTEKADIYSASLVIWYILTGRKPEIDIRENPRLRPDVLVGKNRWAQIAELIVDMWADQPEQRPSAGVCVTRLLTIKDIPDLSQGAAPKEPGCCTLQ